MAAGPTGTAFEHAFRRIERFGRIGAMRWQAGSTDRDGVKVTGEKVTGIGYVAGEKVLEPAYGTTIAPAKHRPEPVVRRYTFSG